ncbi:MAG: hypothetical protein LKI42_04065 [Bacteroidales bacterium]|jgi:hypothetical protein|nr:hypothetical protein [Bacteroidales bacterium]MCI1785928.1 hypothetical protein [Bacteroidales bacterium]
MKKNEESFNAYKTPEIEEVEVSGTSPLLTGSTEPDSVYTYGGDAW